MTGEAAETQCGISLSRFVEFLETLTSSCNTACAGLVRGEFQPRDGVTVEEEMERVEKIRQSAQLLINESQENGAIMRTVPIPFSPNSGHWSLPGVFTERITRKDLAYLLLNSADPIIGGVLYEWKVRYLSAGIYELSVRKKEF